MIQGNRRLIQRLVEATKFETPGKERFFLDKRGTHFANMTSKNFQDRAWKYAEARQLAVAKLLTLGELLRERGAFTPFGDQHQLQITATGAFWQAFQGTEEHPACHTMPSLILFDKHLPHLLAQWADVPNPPALQIQIATLFAECVIMPAFVNRIDQALDESFGGPALVEAMKLIRDGASAREALWAYQRALSTIYEPLRWLSPPELRRVLGRLQNAAIEEPDDPATDHPLTLEEDAILARLDDPVHQMITAYDQVQQRESIHHVMARFRSQISADMKAK